jgi:hypothetical protein
VSRYCKYSNDLVWRCDSKDCCRVSRRLECQIHDSKTALKCRVPMKPDGTRWRTGGEVKGKLANGVGSQYSSHYLGTWCIQHYYRWCAHLGCQHSTELTPPADLNGLVRFAERRNLVSARVPSRFKRSLPTQILSLPSIHNITSNSDAACCVLLLYIANRPKFTVQHNNIISRNNALSVSVRTYCYNNLKTLSTF